VADTGRRKLLFRSVEIAANFATLGVAVLLAVAIWRSHLLTAPSLGPALARSNTLEFPQPVAGTDMSKRLPGIAWERNGRTLVLALSTHCHFCTESMPFFKRVRKSLGKDVMLVGVLPEPVAEAESYLKREGVQLDELRQVALSQAGVAGTPTMLLVDRHGIVLQAWVAKLEPGKQEEFFKTMLSLRSAAAGAKAAVVLEAADGAPARAVTRKYEGKAGEKHGS
jgi:hypothetical protein